MDPSAWLVPVGLWAGLGVFLLLHRGEGSRWRWHKLLFALWTVGLVFSLLVLVTSLIRS